MVSISTHMLRTQWTLARHTVAGEDIVAGTEHSLTTACVETLLRLFADGTVNRQILVLDHGMWFTRTHMQECTVVSQCLHVSHTEWRHAWAVLLWQLSCAQSSYFTIQLRYTVRVHI